MFLRACDCRCKNYRISLARLTRAGDFSRVFAWTRRFCQRWKPYSKRAFSGGRGVLPGRGRRLPVFDAARKSRRRRGFFRGRRLTTLRPERIIDGYGRPHIRRPKNPIPKKERIHVHTTRAPHSRTFAASDACTSASRPRAHCAPAPPELQNERDQALPPGQKAGRGGR